MSEGPFGLDKRCHRVFSPGWGDATAFTHIYIYTYIYISTSKLNKHVNKCKLRKDEHPRHCSTAVKRAVVDTSVGQVNESFEMLAKRGVCGKELYI